MKKVILSLALLAALQHAVAAEPAALILQAQKFNDANQPKQALPLAQEALRQSPTDSEQQIEASICLGDTFYYLQQFQSSEQAYQQGLLLRQRLKSSDPLAEVILLLRLAQLYQRSGQEPKSEPLYVKILSLREKVLGRDHLDVAKTLDALAGILLRSGRYSEAAALYVRDSQICEARLGPKAEPLVGIWSNLGECYLEQGDFARAEPPLQKALALAPKDSYEEAVALDKLGGLYRQKNLHGMALQAYARSLKLMVLLLGPQHQQVGVSLNNIGSACQEAGQSDKAIEAYQQALPILRKSQDKGELSMVLQNLGQLQLAQGNLAAAEKNLLEAQGLVSQDERLLAYVDYSLASVYLPKKQFAESERLFLRAQSSLDKILGPNHPRASRILDGLAQLKLDTQQTPASLQYALQALEVRKRVAANILAYSSEAARLLYFSDFRPYDMLATLGSSEVLRAALCFKGLVLDSILEDRSLATRSPEKRQLLERLMVLQQAWTRQSETSTDQGAPTPLKLEIGKLEAALGSDVSERRALTVNPQQVQNCLPPRSVLIEFVAYEHYLGADSAKPWERRYGAVILPPAGPARWVGLGSQDDFLARLETFEGLVGGAAGRNLMRLGRKKIDEASVLSQMYQQIWAPLESCLPAGTDQVILCPDGALNYLSFSTLVDSQGQFLAERYAISYVASGRDLLATGPTVAEPGKMVLVSNPDFGTGPGGFAPLPGTARESQLLRELAQGAGVKVEEVSQKAASEAYLKQVQTPTILHLATHGFLLPEGEGPMEGIVSLRRSGLALCGAQSTLQQWQQNQIPDPEKDGILNAEEVSALHLQGTWLVTLSACDTGAGKTFDGEGVMGLRRGFGMAGTQNLLMTLWPVADQETADFMRDFYQRALKSHDARSALAQTQKEWLLRLRQQQGVAQAARLAGPFALSFRGHP